MPHLFVVIDEFGELLSAEPDARDLRLHVILTRPSAGSGRAMYEPTLQALRDTGGSLLLLSGDRGEGPIVPGVYTEQMVPGRGRFIRRGQPPFIIQTVHSRPAEQNIGALGRL